MLAISSIVFSVFYSQYKGGYLPALLIKPSFHELFQYQSALFDLPKSQGGAWRSCHDDQHEGGFYDQKLEV